MERQCNPDISIWTLLMLALLSSLVASMLGMTTKIRTQKTLFILNVILFIGLPIWAMLANSYENNNNPNSDPIRHNTWTRSGWSCVEILNVSFSIVALDFGVKYLLTQNIKTVILPLDSIWCVCINTFCINAISINENFWPLAFWIWLQCSGLPTT